MGLKKGSPPPTPYNAAAGDVGQAVVAAPPRPPEVAPFLTKLYDMVSDPASDAVISWGSGGGSFVIWDAHAFERDMLPVYYKHNHITSFIRQLNTYGFRKVDPDRWEWANEGFVRGQKHLLKTITRKKKSSQNATHELQQSPGKSTPGREFIEIGKYGGLEKEVEALKRDKTVLMQQLVDLRHYQQTSNLEVQNVKQRLQVMEQNQQQMMALLAIVVQNPDLVSLLVHQHRSNWWKPDANKKRRFRALEQGCSNYQQGCPNDQEASNGQGQIIKYHPSGAEASNPVLPVNGVFSSNTVPPVSSAALPMDIEMTSNDVNNVGSSVHPFLDLSDEVQWDELQKAFGDDLPPVNPPYNNDQLDPPLSIQDYDLLQSEQDYQMEALDNFSPQHANVWTEA